MAKILIAVPTFETIYPDTYKGIWDVDKDGHQVFFDSVRGYDVATARNRIAQKSLDLGVDFVLMVDNDVVLPENALKLLLEDAKDVNRFCRKMREGHDGLMNCSDLLKRNAELGGDKKQHCDGMVYDAVRAVTEILAEKGM